MRRGCSITAAQRATGDARIQTDDVRRARRQGARENGGCNVRRREYLAKLRRQARDAGLVPFGHDGTTIFTEPKAAREIAALANIMRNGGYAEAQIAERVADWRGEWAATYAPHVVVDPDIMGGVPVFRDTRVTVAVVFENLADGMSLDDILDEYETLNRADVEAVLEIRRKLPAP
jgi:uncharacterized protein (DUF433 family)